MTIDSFLIIAQLQSLIFAIGAVLVLVNLKTRDLHLFVLGFCLLISVSIGFSSGLIHNQNIHDSLMVILKLLMSFFVVGTFLLLVKLKSSEQYIKIIGFALLASVVGDFAAGLFHDLKISTNYAASVYRIFALPLTSLLYFYALGGRYKRLFITISTLYITFGITNVIFIQKASINTYTLIVNSIIVIVFSLYYFYWLLKELPTAQLQRLPMFWINSAYIIYYSGNLFLFLFTSYLVNVLNSNLLVYWSLHNILGIIEGLMIVIALWLDLRNIKSPS